MVTCDLGESELNSRLDEEKLEKLRTWGAGLGEDQREEVRAAGRAILLLIAEIEQLHVDLWNARARVGGGAADAGTAAAPADEFPAEDLERPLRRKLRFTRRHSPQE